MDLRGDPLYFFPVSSQFMKYGASHPHCQCRGRAVNLSKILCMQCLAGGRVPTHVHMHANSS